MDLKNQAIKTALTGDWHAAIEINKTLLEQDSHDVDALNRLAFAYGELGDIEKAKETYQQVLEYDAFNPIALKNLKRLANNAGIVPARTSMLTNAFLEETGKTKVIDLNNIGQPDVLRRLRMGSSVNLQVKRSKIFVVDENSQFIGMLPDNISNRLITLMEGGNTYDACIKSLDKNRVTVFIKETTRASRFKFQPSFLSSNSSQLEIHENGMTKKIKIATR